MSNNPFHNLASQWWDQEGPFHTLHDINPCRLAYVEKFVNLSQKKVLDLGCGGGILSESIAHKGADVLGIDIEKNLIEVAKAHAKQEGLSIDYQAMAVEEYKGKSFDVIVCMEMLEHVDDPGQILQECQRLLKPNGYLFLSTINRSLKAYLELILMGEYVLKLLPRQTHDYRLFIKPSELFERLQDLGMKILDLQGMSYHPWRRQTTLSKSVDVNYLICAQKPLD
jgi:2-polyprenyl-6-hydroxyphenyl methylase/3-demethylubiquinone-9 3-methyltransferase